MQYTRLYGLIFAFAVVALLAHAYNGSFSRYISDDYCTTAVGLEYGISGGMIHWYQTWAGLYTNFLIKSTLAFLPAQFLGVLPSIMIALMVAALSWCSYQVVMLLQIPRPRLTALLFALVIVAATMQGSPVIVQSLYWMAGSIPYSLPLVVLALYVGLIVRQLRYEPDHPLPLGAMLGGALLAFIGGGLTETYITMQIGLFGLIGVGAFFLLPPRPRRKILLVLAASLAGGLLALVTVLAAPGNAIRQANYPPPMPLLQLIPESILQTLGLVATITVIFAPLPLVMVLLLSGLLAYKINPPQQNFTLRPARVRLLLGASALAAYVLILACTTPAVYATSDLPPARVFIIPVFIMLVTAGFWGYVMGLSLRKPSAASAHRLPVWVGAAVLILCLIGPGAATWNALSTSHIFRAYGTEWDAREQQILTARAEGITQVVVYELEHEMENLVGLMPITPDPDYPLNRCAAFIYDVESVTALPLEG